MPKQERLGVRGRERGAYARLAALAPDVVAAYEALAASTRTAGALDDRTVALLKLAVSVGEGSWRGVHAHARKALEQGIAPNVLRQVPVVALPTVGLHGALDALRWIDEIVDEAGA